MPDDVMKVYEEYFEQMLFCRFFVAEKLNHNAEMGRCGENILKKQLAKRFNMLEFVTGFIVCDRVQSPQCDILVCRKNMLRRQLDDSLFLVEPRDCLMVIEVKGNCTLRDISETDTKNNFFVNNDKMKHIELALFAYKTRIGKRPCTQNLGMCIIRVLSHI